ncbi:MAG: PfkB family carbohydrate kinase [Bacteroidia bacterium]|nr:PfkB family carbohydrate kinase [Bacteroidia bacterium]MDW8301949.1 PfkB family carbohydrate kinase [Bacteroidia bacterium]
MSILVVGSVAFDAIETPFGKTDKIIGGAATYISIVSSYFSKEVYLVSVVGGDFPASAIEDFKKRNINVEGLEIKPNEKSFFWSGRYHEDMNSRDTLITELNVLANFEPKILPIHQQAEFVMLGNLAPDIQRSVLQKLQKRPKLVVMDTMNFWMETARSSLIETLKLTDVLVINDEEARQLSNLKNLKHAAQAILAMGPKILVIKKGEHGAMLFAKTGEFFNSPALLLDRVVDPTGAGDCFAAGFISYLSQQQYISFEAMKHAVLYGSVMASFCVEEFGPNGIMHLTHDKIKERYFQLLQSMKIAKH